jgi:hypothetical protein
LCPGSMKQALLILFVLGILLAPATFALAQEMARPPLLTFDDLGKNDGIDGPFRIEGYVLDIYKCPPCPPGTMCKPCIPDNVVITDTANPKDLSKINRLRIFTDKPEQFKQKKKYSFTVKLKQPLPAAHAITAVDLVSFEPLK